MTAELTVVAEVAEDAAAALTRLQSAESFRLQRRAMREAVGHLYSLDAYLGGEDAPAHARVLYKADLDSPEGRVVRGLVYIREQLTHGITRSVDPAPVGGVFDADAFDVAAFDCGELMWLPDNQVPMSTYRTRQHYRWVAERPVIETMQTALDFLVPRAIQRSTAAGGS